MTGPLLAVALMLGAAAPPDTGTFQQGVSYRIEAILDEPGQVLHGRARMRYVNHSPDVLDTLYFHQYLNAFRPNSAWARRELKFGERRFQDLGPKDHGFERFTRLEVNGVAVRPSYPFAPDSTVAAVPLPRSLQPGDSLVVDMDWDARPSTVPRRQGRKGRHYDFAQWYPRIATYDTAGWEDHVLLPQGEFYGEYASWDVSLDVAEDQVIGSTGVPVEGDPGWQHAAAGGRPVEIARDAYPPKPPEALGLLDGPPAAGRKRVRWRAEHVHHFAWSTDPAYIYEGGRAGDVLLHVLYRPGDEAEWGDGKAVDRSRTALEWLESKLGPYPYPQLTNLHRLEGGGTEFPMLVMNGGASQGLITHEFSHQWMMGILGSNEWKQAWLDEGFASFMTAWFEEAHGDSVVWKNLLTGLARREAAGRTQPVGLPAEDFVDYGMYGAMSYTKGEAILYMLRQLIGVDAFSRGLEAYSRNNRYRHVTEADLRHAMEQASRRDLGWFFHQWLHTTDRLDYGIGDVSSRAEAGGRWVTRVEVLRTGQAWMPVTLEVGNRTRELTSHDRRQVVTVSTRQRPGSIVLDPDYDILDMDRSNNTRVLHAANAVTTGAESRR